MKRLLFFLLTILLWYGAIFAQDSDSIHIRIIYPSAKRALYLEGKPIYMTGRVSVKNAKLFVNDEPSENVEITKDGFFLIFATPKLFQKDDKQFGKFVFKVISSSDTAIIEKVYSVILPPATQSESSFAFDPDWRVKPLKDVSLLPGAILEVEAKFSPNAKLEFEIEGISERFPMVETEEVISYLKGDAIFGEGFSGLNYTIRGIYKGSVRLTDSFGGLKDANITIYASREGEEPISKKNEATLTILDNTVPIVARTLYSPNYIIGRYESGKGYAAFLQERIQLEVSEIRGKEYGLRLTDDINVFVHENEIELLEKGTPPPKAEISVINTSETDTSLVIELGFSERVVCKFFEENPELLHIDFYNVIHDLDWIRQFRKSDFLKDIQFDWHNDNVFSLNVTLNQKNHWGYSTKYDNSTLKITINKPPKENTGGLFTNNQLEGRKIVIDPGHTPDPGAVGPGGLTEKEVNLKISLYLKEMLEESGAKVFFTHSGEGIGLLERRAKVNSFSPDISVSVHNNAVPQGVNPHIYNGSSVYYYYPQAFPLAEKVHKYLLEDIGLRDHGLYFGNLYMCRIPETIAILVEPDFMIIPHQEELLKTSEYQKKVAEAIYKGIEEFFEEYSE